jgi:hypothetical protein
MSKESQEFRNKAAAEFRASRENSAFGTRTPEFLRKRAKSYKALAENEEWLSGEKAPLTSSPTARHKTG